jgi:hypothetical protein
MNSTKSFPPADDAMTALAEVFDTIALTIEHTDWAPVRAELSARALNGVRYVMIACAILHTLFALTLEWWANGGREQTVHVYTRAQEIAKVCVSELRSLYADIYTQLIRFDVLIDTPINVNFSKWLLADLKVYANHTGKIRKADLLELILN